MRRPLWVRGGVLSDRLPYNGAMTQTLSPTGPAPVLVPVASLTVAPWNPRTISESRFKNLCASLSADPDFLWRRPLLANGEGIVMGGNMRLRAAIALGWQQIPAIVEDIPDQLAKERALKDNGSWGEWQDEDLAELLYGLQEAGAATDLLGFDEAELARFLNLVAGPDFEPVGPEEQGRLDQKATVTCPECGHVFTP